MIARKKFGRSRDGVELIVRGGESWRDEEGEECGDGDFAGFTSHAPLAMVFYTRPAYVSPSAGRSSHEVEGP